MSGVRMFRRRGEGYVWRAWPERPSTSAAGLVWARCVPPACGLWTPRDGRRCGRKARAGRRFPGLATRRSLKPAPRAPSGSGQIGFGGWPGVALGKESAPRSRSRRAIMAAAATSVAGHPCWGDQIPMLGPRANCPRGRGQRVRTSSRLKTGSAVSTRRARRPVATERQGLSARRGGPGQAGRTRSRSMR